ncbi:MAG TPA: preprotein translocase subunit SecE [Patescibacteria group bacterium]
MRKIFSFLKEVRAELSKVTWPSRSRTLRLTTIVVIVTILFGAFMGVVDYGLNEGLQAVLDATDGGGVKDAQPIQAPTGGEQAAPVQVPQPTK